MRAKSYLIFTTAFVTALSAAALIPAAAFAVAPTITVMNNGGVPTKGTRKCEFTAQGQKCKLLITNGSAFAVLVKAFEITPPEGTARYGIEGPNGCTVGTELAATGGACILEIKRSTAGGPCPQLNGYAIEVEEKGNPANFTRESAFLEMS
jgi:hypothetical protein